MRIYLSIRNGLAIGLVTCLAVCQVTLTHAADKVARAATEPLRGGLAPEAYLDRQIELHAWLMSELPAGTLDAPISVPLTDRDRRAIANDAAPLPRPQRVGIVKQVGKTVRLWRGGKNGKSAARPALGAIRETDDGGFAWAMAFESPGASALRVRLSDVSLADSADVYFFSLDGQAYGPNRGHDDFWSDTLIGAQGIVLVRQFGPVAPEIKSMSVAVTSVGNIGEKFAVTVDGLCNYNHPCIEDAEEHAGQPVTDLQAATAYMEWVQGAWIYSCSGGLLADSNPGSQVPYFLTANHCLKSNAAAGNLELYWNYTASNGGCSGPTTPKTMGATVKATGGKGDFTLLELNQSPPQGSIFMGWTNTPVATMPGLGLHRVHHPSGAPQSYSTHVTDPDFGTCRALPIPQFIYSEDTLGSTEGGSSGSLVANGDGEVVGQLYGACGSNFDECLSDNWRTVDGAFAYYYDKVAPFLGASCEPTPEVCDDGADNDCDAQVDCSDVDCLGDPACPSSCGPKNAACTDAGDCCSGICKRNGRCR